MKALTFAVTLTLASITLGRTTAAQEMSQFHAGEWGAEFSGGSATSIGVMRFFNPQSAFVVNFSGSLRADDMSSPGGTGSTKASQQGLWMAPGVRRHRSIAPRVLAYSEVGAILSFAHSHQRQTDGFGNATTASSTNASYGLYGELGGQYFIAPHVALGAAVTLQGVAYNSRARSAAGTATSHGFSVAATTLPIRLTLYF